MPVSILNFSHFLFLSSYRYKNLAAVNLKIDRRMNNFKYNQPIITGIKYAL
jgi:hypothetical protein